MATFSLKDLVMTHVPARLTARFGAIAVPPSIATADNLAEAFTKDDVLPLVAPIFSRGPAMTQSHGGRRLVLGNRKQRRKIQISIAVVAESFATDLKDASRIGVLDLIEWVEDTLVGWPATPAERSDIGLLKSFEFLDDPFVMRSADLTRLMHQVMLETEAEVFTTPVP